MRPARSTILLLILLLANAAAILFFRFFITVDGPMHVFYAALNAPWATADHMAHGITYNGDPTHALLGDGVLMVMMLFFSPEQAHDLFAAMVSCAVVLSVVALFRAYGTPMGPAILWLAPFTFNPLLIMGLFHFLLGVAIAFGAVAWWKWQAASPRARWAGLLIGVVIAWSAHRSSPVLLGMFLLPAFVIELIQTRAIIANRIRRTPLSWIAVMIALLAMIALQMYRVLQGVQLPIPTDLPALDEALLLLPLLLPGTTEEQWPVRAIAILFLIAVGAGARARWGMGRKLFAHDALPVLSLLFTTIAWLCNTPLGHQLLIAERCQWLALVTLVVWLVAIADAHRGWVAHVIGGAALCALPLQVIRLVQAEESFSHLRQARDSVRESCDALDPGSLVLPVLAEHNWLLQHLWAYVAIDHNGILLAPNDRMVFAGTAGVKLDARLLRMAKDPHWIARHWRNGMPPEVDQILFIGSDIERVVSKHPWPGLLAERYRQSFNNGYARVYTQRTTREAVFR